MKCPYCEHWKTKVTFTDRLTDEIIRGRKCDACGKNFETVEVTSRVRSGILPSAQRAIDAATHNK